MKRALRRGPYHFAMLRSATNTKPAFDPHAVRADFPILQTQVNGHPLVYLDNAATVQKPRAVIDAIVRYYEHQNANIHRAVHHLGQQATDAYEEARRTVQKFLNAADAREIIFTRGTTEGVNLVASSWGRANLKPGDEVLLTAVEHHSNIVPWQLACEATGATLKVVPMADDGDVPMAEFENLLNEKTKLVAFTHLSNALGTILPAKEICAKAHAVGATVLIDGAQWVGHFPTDVRDIDADFYVFSGHKLYGPTGIGVLYGKLDLLEKMPPYQGGGDMISSVTFERTEYAELPNKFEAGTPHIAGAVGLAAAIDYIQSVGGLAAIAAYEDELLDYAREAMQKLPGVRPIGTAAHKAAVLSFVIETPPIPAHDVGILLDGEGVAVRTGHHCCQPVMDRLGLRATVRASLAMYNTREDIDALVAAVRKVTADAARHLPAEPQETTGLDDIAFPEPVAASPDEAAAELIEAFEFLGEWEARHEYLMDLGGKIPRLPGREKTDANRVHGCQSTVHLTARKRPGTADVLDFAAESDAFIVNGLIALLERVFAGQPARQILDFDVLGFLKKLGLDQHLSMGRRNGLAGMIERIRAEAEKLAN